MMKRGGGKENLLEPATGLCNHTAVVTSKHSHVLAWPSQSPKANLTLNLMLYMKYNRKL